MKLFSRKEKIVLYSEQQKDQFIEKLEKAHIEYALQEKEGDLLTEKPSYIIRLAADDLKKVV